MKETPYYFPNGRYSLFGVLHEPERADAKPAFVFCHPFGEEKLWTHRVFVSFARRLAEEGHAVLRFDYMGNGDSEGDFVESSLETALADVRAAIDTLRQQVGAPSVSLLGLRLGATIASLAAEGARDIEQLVLWAPIVDGAKYMQELLRINLTTQMAVHREIRQDREALALALRQGVPVNVDGYEMAYPMYSEVSAVKLAAAPHEFAGPTLIVQVDRQERPAPDLRLLAGSYPSATLSFAEEEPFWKEIPRFYQQAPNLFTSTAAWLRDC